MRRVLHIHTRADDPLARELMAAQQKTAEIKVEAVDLTAREPDYQKLLEKIFESDSIETW